MALALVDSTPVIVSPPATASKAEALGGWHDATQQPTSQPTPPTFLVVLSSFPFPFLVHTPLQQCRGKATSTTSSWAQSLSPRLPSSVSREAYGRLRQASLWVPPKRTKRRRVVQSSSQQAQSLTRYPPPLVWHSQVTPQEQTALVKGFDDPSALQSGGLHVAGKKYFCLQANDRSIYGKAGVSSRVPPLTPDAP